MLLICFFLNPEGEQHLRQDQHNQVLQNEDVSIHVDNTYAPRTPNITHYGGGNINVTNTGYSRDDLNDAHRNGVFEGAAGGSCLTLIIILIAHWIFGSTNGSKDD